MAERPERIVLVGVPGAGKSTVGRILAARLGWQFVDLDARIEAETGLTVTEIFADKGEEEFRRLESELTERLASLPDVILAPGGGWILRNRLPGASVVWLQVEVGEAVRRMGNQVGTRPLLSADPVEGLKQLLAEREPHYMRSDIAIDTNGKSPDEIAAAITTAFGMYGNQNEE